MFNESQIRQKDANGFWTNNYNREYAKEAEELFCKDFLAFSTGRKLTDVKIENTSGTNIDKSAHIDLLISYKRKDEPYFLGVDVKARNNDPNMTLDITNKQTWYGPQLGWANCQIEKARDVLARNGKDPIDHDFIALSYSDQDGLWWVLIPRITFVYNLQKQANVDFSTQRACSANPHVTYATWISGGKTLVSVPKKDILSLPNITKIHRSGKIKTYWSGMTCEA